MAKKAAARKMMSKKSAKKGKRAAGKRAAARPKRRGVDFKPLHDAMDATIAALSKQKKSIKRDALIVELRILRKFKPCPTTGMFVELE
jgi:hypothetical protein